MCHVDNICQGGLCMKALRFPSKAQHPGYPTLAIVSCPM